jgi:hypothetical protein
VPTCPSCHLPLDPQAVPPRGNVAYVRDRVLLICRGCLRTAAVEIRERGQAPARPKTGEARDLPRVGWREWVRIAGVDLPAIKAKIDTGARTSALHAEALEFFEITPDAGGAPVPMVRFLVLPAQRSREGTRQVEAPLVEHRGVRSSSGRQERRPVVQLTLQMGSIAIPAEVTLTRRDLMGFRMLVGRTALRGRFLVDPGASFVQPLPDSPPKSSSPPTRDPSS